MFTTLLVANRGEIALRIFRSCCALGIRTVAVYSDADRDAPHVRAADEAVRIGPAPAAASYLDVDAILAAARQTGADAVHPGYGFLSERPEFAEACAAAGIAFVGPPASALRLLGDKGEARRLAIAHDVPVLPGVDVDAADDAATLAAAQAIGFPVMVKAAAGGGGRGMRLVESAEALPDALTAAAREATAAFGDGRLLIERAVVGGRHVEVQVIADRHGHAIHLGERDCSIQRRFQKVIEESPSPAVDAALRERLGEAALRLVRAAGYENAGTVEFLLAPDGSFTFMEVNARLQVEHGVTELVTGLDLVALQLQVAAGEPLPLTQADVVLNGHALECRLYAEDPTRGYVASPGRLERWALPSGAGVRVDAGYEAGSTVPAEYDALLAKLMTHAPSRAEAIARARSALDTSLVEGVRTNLGLLAAVLAEPAFRDGTAALGFLDAMAPEQFAARLPAEVIAAAAAQDLLHVAPGDGAAESVWERIGPWRVDGSFPLAYRFHGADFTARAERAPGERTSWTLEIDGATHALTAARTRHDELRVTLDGVAHRWHVVHGGGLLHLRRPDGSAVLLSDPPQTAAAASRTATAATAGPNVLRAPMPGTVLAVLVAEGASVSARQPLVTLEAMKMEHHVEAPRDGIVAELHCAPGQQVAEGDVLVTLALPSP